jgi:putative GTP pyrophosphokinase
MPHADGLSGNRIKSAGKLLRKWGAGEPCDQVEIDDAVAVLMTYRKRVSAGGQPLASVNMSLRSMVQTSTKVSTVEVTQRLKRVDRIIQKLVRHPDMQLTKMDDIGGCRVVVPTLPELWKIQRYVDRKWGENVKTRRDYITNPKPTGYRAYHLVIVRSEMPIEVQLRTAAQQNWAKSVEEAETRTGSMLKDGHGDADILDMFRLLGDAFAYLDRDEIIPLTLRDEIVSGVGPFRKAVG